MVDENDLILLALAPTVGLVMLLVSDMILGVPNISDGNVGLSDEEKKYLGILCVSLAMIKFFHLVVYRGREMNHGRGRREHQGRRNGHRPLLRRRGVGKASSSSMAAVPSQTDFEDEMRPLLQACASITIPDERPILPVWLVDSCRATIKKDDGYLCVLLSRHRDYDNELQDYIEQNGFLPSDYGLNLREALAYLSQHGDALRAKLQHAFPSTAALPL